jgi:hypothetical protein
MGIDSKVFLDEKSIRAAFETQNLNRIKIKAVLCCFYVSWAPNEILIKSMYERVPS